MVKKQYCYRGHSELPLTHKNRDKLDLFAQLIHTSKDAIGGPTKRQVSNKVHGLYREALSWVINWLKQSSRDRGKLFLPLANMIPTNESGDIKLKTIPPSVMEQGR